MGSQYLSLKHYKMKEVKQFPPLSAVGEALETQGWREQGREGGSGQHFRPLSCSDDNIRSDSIQLRWQ